MATNLTLWDRTDPADGQVDGHGHNPSDPIHLTILFAIEPEDDGEDYATQITRCAGDARDDPCSEKTVNQ